MKRTRYVIVDEYLGVFLGTYSGDELGAEDDDRMYACFAAHNPFGLTTACSFHNESTAKYFIRNTFAPNKRADLKPLPVETESEYPTVVDLIKSGYSEYTHDMLDAMFEYGNQTIH